MPHRAPRQSADAAIANFLQATIGDVPDFTLEHDRGGGWKFWIEGCCYTSYVHADLSIEWYGTTWRPDQSIDAAGLNDINPTEVDMPAMSDDELLETLA